MGQNIPLFCEEIRGVAGGGLLGLSPPPLDKGNLLISGEFHAPTGAEPPLEIKKILSLLRGKILEYAHKSPKYYHLFPAAVNPHEHQLRHREHYHVNHAKGFEFLPQTQIFNTLYLCNLYTKDFSNLDYLI